jgi:membrane protein
MRRMDPLVRVEAYLAWLVSRPIAELSRWQRRLRFLVDLSRHSSRQMSENDSGEMAAALTYRTIFGLVPLLMVSMLAFRLFGDMEQAAQTLQKAAYAFFNYQVDMSRPEAAAFKEALDGRILDVVKGVSGLSFETIGAIGALLLIWAALNLLVSFENATNKIYRAPRGRSWFMRVGIYWSVLTLGPILLLVVLYAVEYWLDRAEGLTLVGPFFAFLGHFGSLAGSFLVLVLLYKLMPNTHVRWRPSLAGALVAATLWALSKWAFGLYVSRALPYLKLYGAIGLIPLFLFWLYLNWLIVLFGLEIAFTLQTMRGRVIERPEPDNTLKLSDPLWLVPLTAAIARGSRKGEPVSRQKLAEDLGLRLEAVAELVGVLEEDGLVLHTTRPGSEDVGLMLALPAELVPLDRVVALAGRRTLGEKAREGPGWVALAWLHEKARSAAAERTVADLL